MLGNILISLTHFPYFVSKVGLTDIPIPELFDGFS